MARGSEAQVLIVVRGKDDISPQLKKIAGNFNTVGRNAGGLDKQFLGLGNSVLGMGAKMAKVAVGGLALMGAGLTAVGVLSVKMASEFDTAMRNVNAVAQLPEEQFKALKAEVIDFSMTTRASADEVAGALYNVVSAGLDLEKAVEVPVLKVRELADGTKELYTDVIKTSEGMAVMQMASRAAGAGLAETDETSRLLIATLRSYNMGVEESGNVMDVWLHTVNRGLTTLPELNASMGRILPTASNLGVEVEELGFLMSNLTQTGLSTELATTRLNAAMVAMIKPQKPLQEALESLGYASGTELVESAGSLTGALRVLQQNGLLDTNEQVAALFPNIRAMGGIMALLKSDTALASGELEKFAEASKGAVERAREEQYKSLSANIAKLKSAFEAIGIAIGDAFLPVLNTVVQRLQPLVVEFGKKLPDAIAIFKNTFTDMFQGLRNETGKDILGRGVESLANLFGIPQEVSDKIVAFAGKLYELGQVVKNSVGVAFAFLKDTIFPAVAQAIQFVMEHWDAFKGAIIALGAVLASAAIAAVLAGIISALAAVVSPIGLIVAAVALLGAAWSSNFMGIRDTLTAFWENSAKPALTELYEWLQVNIPIAIQTLSQFWQNTLLPAIQTVAAFIQNPLIPIITTIANIIGTILGTAIKLIAGYFRDIWLPAMRAVGEFIGNYISPIVLALADVVGAILGVAIKLVAGYFENVFLPSIRLVANFIKDTVVPWFAKLTSAAEDDLGPALAWLKDNLIDPLGEGFGRLKTAVEKVSGAIGNFADKIRNIKIPDVLMPGSPSPLEESFAGINSEVVNATRGIEGFGQALSQISTGGGELGFAFSEASMGDYAGFINEYQDMQDEILGNEQDFQTKMGNIRASAAEKMTAAQEGLTTKLEDIETQRQEKLHWVMTGAHARTAEENEAALAHWNAHYDQLSADAQAGYADQTSKIEGELAKKNAALAAAREKEIADQQAAMTRLKLSAALGVMESQGLLEGFTGGMATSVTDALALIESGMLQLTEGQAAQLGLVMGDLATTSEEAAAGAEANAALISQAISGELEAKAVPAIQTTGEEFGILQEQMARQTQENVLPAVQELDLAIGNIPGFTLPAVQEQSGVTNESMTTGFTSTRESAIIPLNTSLEEMIALLTTLAGVAQSTATTIKSAFSGITSIFNAITSSAEKLVKVIEKIASEAKKAKDALEKLSDMDAFVPPTQQGGLGGQHGLDMIVPPGYPGDTFPFRATSGERVTITPKNEIGQGGNTYNLNVYSSAPTEDIVADFRMLESVAMAGA